MQTVSMSHLSPLYCEVSFRLQPRFESSVGRVARGFFLQCWLKELLTEGEWFLMNLLPLITLTQQGTYQVGEHLPYLGPGEHCPGTYPMRII